VQARDDTTGRTDERCFYAKAYNDEEGERTFRSHQALRSSADEDGGTFMVGRPIAYLSSLQVLLQEEIPGTSLEDILLREEDATLAVRKAAECLAALHLDHVPAPRHHPVRNEIAALERAGRILRWACPHLQAKIGGTVGAVVGRLQEVPPTPTHRDLKLDHILLDGHRAALLDLDDFAEADPVLDTANFLAHLGGIQVRFPLLREDRWRTATHTFDEEYFTRVPDAWRVRLPVHYAGAVLKMAVGFFRRQEPDWPDRIATLVEEARSSLAGRIW
jgi:Phosphotransferase enzyme family